MATGEYFRFDENSIEVVDKLAAGMLKHIPTDDLTAGLMGDTVGDESFIVKADDRHLYSDVLLDLAELLDEVRYHIALAVLLLADFTHKSSRGEARQHAPSPLDHTGVPIEVFALMAAYRVDPPLPHTLFTAPFELISGNRVLGVWVAGQMLDSAIVRELAIVDRLAILLRIAAGLVVQKNAPAFRPRDFDQLQGSYTGCPTWDQLRAMTEEPLLELAKEWRDSFVHRRRKLSAAHGIDRVIYRAGQKVAIMRGIETGEHVAITLALYNELVGTAIARTGTVLTEYKRRHTAPGVLR